MVRRGNYSPYQPAYSRPAPFSVVIAVAPGSTMAIIALVAPSPATGSPLTGFIDDDCPAADFPAIEVCDGLVSIGIIFHGNEGKTPGPFRFPVCNDFGFFDYSETCKNLLQVRLQHLERQITDEQLFCHDRTP